LPMDSFEMSTILPVDPDRLYHAWLNSGEHSRFTGSPAEIEPIVGGKFQAWDGYIFGKTIQLEHMQRIVQSWRTTEFPEESPDSRLEIRFEAVDGGTKITLIHTDIPEGQGEDYKKGWEDFYFTPMRAYYNEVSG
jgi:activator of HSP90 ATPase